MQEDKIPGITKFATPACIIAIETPYSRNFLPQAIEKKEFSLGSIYYKGENHYFKDPKSFIRNLLKFKCVFSYNGESFIYPVLKKYGLPVKELRQGIAPEGLVSIDMMRYVEKKIGFNLSLKDLYDLNFGEILETKIEKELTLEEMKNNLAIKTKQMYNLLRRAQWIVNKTD